jgi:hypothetical protein
MRRGAGVLPPAFLALVVAAACASPSPTGLPTPTPAPATPAPTALPTPTAVATRAPSPTPAVTPGAVPAGTVPVEIPAAGIRLPVPAGWEQVDAEALADPVRRDDIVDRYPGAAGLLAAAAEMGDRAVPAFAAFDPAAGPGVALTPNIAVLVSQPSVGGPLLDLVAGFVGGGMEDAFEAEEIARGRVPTVLGDAVRLEYRLPADGGTPMAAVDYLVGAPAGTLLVSVMGPAETVTALDPDALVAALAPLP